MVSAWIVVDDSGSMSAYDGRVRRVHKVLVDELECSFDVTTWTTSSRWGMSAGLDPRPIGAGHGDGLRHMIDHVASVSTSAMLHGPAFTIYLTDNAAALNAKTVADIARHNIVLVNVLDDRWNVHNVPNTLIQLHDFLIHECADDCCECDPTAEGYDCECNDGFCLASVESGAQPFYREWASMTAALRPRLVEQEKVSQLWKEARRQVRALAEHPVDIDLRNIERAISGCKGQDLYKRATLGCELHGKIKKILGGNTLTPSQQDRIKAIRYLIYTVCLDFSNEAAVKAAYYGGTDTTAPTPNEVQEGQPMSAQITTTVSLKMNHQHRATIADFKTLIAEVERVGGTDESFVNLESVHRSGCLDAVVVTAVEVTEPTLDPRVECVLSIQDEEKRTHALVDLLIDFPVLRAQITPHLVGSSKPAKAAKKATAPKQ